MYFQSQIGVLNAFKGFKTAFITSTKAENTVNTIFSCCGRHVAEDAVSHLLKEPLNKSIFTSLGFFFVASRKLHKRQSYKSNEF
jgi:hypothetical protein